MVSIRVHNRQHVDVHVVQDLSNVLVLVVKRQRLWEKGLISVLDHSEADLIPQDISTLLILNLTHSHVAQTISRKPERSTL